MQEKKKEATFLKELDEMSFTGEFHFDKQQIQLAQGIVSLYENLL